jgi:hypothetical protein
MNTLQGKPRSIRHTLVTLSPCMIIDHTYLTWFMYINLSWVIKCNGRILLLSRKSAPDSTSQPGWVARGTRLSFSPNTTIETVGLSQSSVDGRLLGLLGSYKQHVISTFNTCSWGATHRSLIDTGRGYNLGGAKLPHHTPRLSQPTVLRFPSKGLVWSQVNQSTITNWYKEGAHPKSHEWEPPLDFYCNLSSKHNMS